MSDVFLEVIVCSVEDAVEAEAGGAHRLEMVSRLDVGGLTPTVELVRQIKAEVSLPLRVMVRENVGFEGGDDVGALCETAVVMNEIGVDGLVLGFLRNGELDEQTLSKVLSSAPRLNATFHHAFEAAADKQRLIQALKKFPQIDRILAHGGQGDWSEKIERLISYQSIAMPAIRILVGGGLDPSVIKSIRGRSDLNEFHVGSAAREDGQVRRTRVAELVTHSLAAPPLNTPLT